MREAFERLSSLRVADVMSRGVATVDANASMEQAAKQMCEASHSAVPAVDEQGRCVGVLSATDFLRRECASWLSGDAVTTQCEPEQAIALDGRERDYVSCYMSGGLQSVAAGASLLQAADIMRAAHVHRLPVLDEHGRPVGMVSSMDVISALLNVMDEMNVEQINQARR